MMDFLNKLITAAQSMEDPHTWSKFGATLQAQTQKTEPFTKPFAEPAQRAKPAEIAFVSKDPVKKRVFAIGTAFWLSVLLVGGTYIAIEDTANVKDLVESTLSSIEDDYLKDVGMDVSSESMTGFKLIENTELGFEIQIPERFVETGEDMSLNPDYSDIDPEDVRFLTYSIRKYDVFPETEPTLYREWITPTSPDLNFIFIEEGDTVLNGLPAKKYVYEFDNGSVRDKAIIVVLWEGGMVYELAMFDDVADFPASLAEFEVTRESFFAW